MRRLNRGFAMLDALVALLVLSLGLLALGSCMARQLAGLRATAARHVALQFIDAAAGHLSLSPAGGAGDLPEQELPPGWRADLQAALPGARAHVFRTDAVPPQVGIFLAWPANERHMSAEDRQRQQALLAPALAGTGDACPPELLCHVAYVGP